MCLTLPKRVVAVGPQKISLQAGQKKEIVGSFVPVKKGDWVLTQNNIIIKKITERQAKEINSLLL